MTGYADDEGVTADRIYAADLNADLIQASSRGGVEVGDPVMWAGHKIGEVTSVIGETPIFTLDGVAGGWTKSTLEALTGIDGISIEGEQ